MHALVHSATDARVRAPARVLRASGVAAVWAVFTLPFAIRVPRCAFAAHFHIPCPGCGMTRAVRLMQAGDVLGSLAMHPLAFPVIASTAILAVTTVALMARHGTVQSLWDSRVGRAALFGVLAVQGATLALWALRWLGLFGGPVPV